MGTIVFTINCDWRLGLANLMKIVVGIHQHEMLHYIAMYLIILKAAFFSLLFNSMAVRTASSERMLTETDLAYTYKT